MKAVQNILTVDETDALILAACRPEDGAIEDAEISATQVSYFFETGTVGIVNRTSGWAALRRQV